MHFRLFPSGAKAQFKAVDAFGMTEQLGEKLISEVIPKNIVALECPRNDP
jgi:hypothetical protein